MALQIDLDRYFTAEAIGQVLYDAEPVRTPIWSRVFSKTKQHPLPHISKKTFVETTGNIPVIKRGSSSIGVYDGEDTVDLFDPQPLAVNTIIKASDFLNLQMVGDESTLQDWVADKLSMLRDRIFTTIEALCIQAFVDGEINYAIKIYEGDLGDYKVNFGNLIPVPVAFTGVWGGATIENIFKDILVLKNAIKKHTRYGSTIGILAGETAFYTLVGKAEGMMTSTTVNMRIEEDTVLINGTKIEYMGDAGYTDLKTGAWVDAIGTNDIVLFAEDAPFQLNYLAIDDFDAITGGPQVVARSFFPKSIRQDDPSGYKILVQSKPFPMSVPLATLKVTVI